MVPPRRRSGSGRERSLAQVLAVEEQGRRGLCGGGGGSRAVLAPRWGGDAGEVEEAGKGEEGAARPELQAAFA
jgi:hypothetical protein